MGSSLKVACGWGMSAADFISMTTLPIQEYMQKPCMSSTLDVALSPITELVIPPDDYDALNDRNEPGLGAWDADLLNGGIPYAPTEKGRMQWPERVRVRTADRLYEIVHHKDESDFVLFWPDASARKELLRRDDVLDGIVNMMHPHIPGKEWANSAKTLVSPLMHNPYPWSNDLQIEGKRVAWPGPFGVRDYPDHAPAPPKVLVWWLQKLNVLQPEDAMKLRPYLCRWWS